MAAIGKTRQVIAITHFPQVASLAQHHFVVSKEVEANRTRSTIRPIEGSERIEELRPHVGRQDRVRPRAREKFAGRGGRMKTLFLALCCIATSAWAVDFSTVTHAGKKFILCRVDLKKEKLQILLRDDRRSTFEVL